MGENGKKTVNSVGQTAVAGTADKINVLFVMIHMDMGGSERLVSNLALKLDRNIFNPSIAWFHGDKILDDFYKLGVPLHHVPKIKRFDVATFLKLGKIIKDNNIHIVNAHHFMPMVYSFYGCKISNSVKLVYTEHSVWEIEKISWKWRKIGGRIAKRLDATVGVAEAVSKQFRDKLKMSPDKIFTIQNGADLEALTNSRDKSVLKKNLCIGENEKIIGIVANFKRIKNHIFLLKAFRELVRSYKDVKLLMIGQGFKEDGENNTERELRDFIDKNDLNDKVLLLGYRSDIPDLLNVMDIFCLTSFKEGLPISLTEAMASGLPVVGTDVEGIREVIIPDKNGFLVSNGDVEQLKNVLYTLLMDDSLRQRLGLVSKDIAINTYSLRRCVNEYQDLFLSLMGRK